MINQNKTRKAAHNIRGLAELIPWMVEYVDGVVVNKDGSLMACFVLEGIDIEGHTQIDVDSFAFQAEIAFRELNYRAAVWSTVHRRKKNAYLHGHEIKNTVTAYVDRLWQHQLESEQQYSNSHSFSIILRPEGASSRFFDRVKKMQEEGVGFAKAIAAAAKTMISSKKAFVYETDQLDHQVRDFQNVVASVLTNMAEFKLVQLKGEHLLSYLHKHISPLNEDLVVSKSRNTTYLDTYLADSQVAVFENHLVFSHGRKKFTGAITVKDWPSHSAPGLLDSLLAVPAEITASQVFLFTQEEESEAYIARAEKHMLSSATPLSALVREQLTKEPSNQIDAGKLQLAEDAADAQREITAERKRFGYYNFTVLFYGDTQLELENNRDLVLKALKYNHVVGMVETDHLQSSFATTLPGQYAENKRWSFFNTANLADLAFLRTFLTGPEINEHLTEEMRTRHESLTTLPTELSTPYYFNFHVNDVGHTFVIGPTGNGKSTFSNFLISQFRKYPKSNIFIFDKDYSCQIPTVLQGGTFIDMKAGEGSIKLNPFHLLYEKKHWYWIKSWVEQLLSYRNLEITPEMDKVIWHAIEQTADTERENWRLSTFASFVTQDIAIHLTMWTEGGQYGHFFDNAVDEFNLSDFVAIEMGGLFDNPTLAIAFLEYAFYSIMLKLDGTPTLIEVEEVWFMLGFPHLANKIKDWLKTFRKLNAFVVFATQSLDDLSRSEIFSTIIDSIMTRVYLPNRDALTHYSMYREKFGLSDTQIERIRTGIPKRNYYIVQPGRSRMIDCKFPREIINIMRSNQDAIKTFRKYQASGKPDWEMLYIEDMENGKI